MVSYFRSFPKIEVFDPSVWAERTAEAIHTEVKSAVRRRGICNIILTGGKSAAKVYTAWSMNYDVDGFEDVNFYFGDERCVAPDGPSSNYNTAMKTLFIAGVPSGCTVHRMQAERDDLEEASDSYAAVLPNHIDVLLLGVGEDGHIASLFPHSKALHENKRRVLPIVGPQIPYKRLTITPPVIAQAKTTFLIASGREKSAALAKALSAPNDIDKIPACLVKSGSWLLDTPIDGFFEPTS